MIGVRVDLPRSLAVTLQSDHTDERIRAPVLFLKWDRNFFFLSLSLYPSYFLLDIIHTHYRLLPFFFLSRGWSGTGREVGSSCWRWCIARQVVTHQGIERASTPSFFPLPGFTLLLFVLLLLQLGSSCDHVISFRILTLRPADEKNKNTRQNKWEREREKGKRKESPRMTSSSGARKFVAVVVIWKMTRSFLSVVVRYVVETRIGYSASFLFILPFLLVF